MRKALFLFVATLVCAVNVAAQEPAVREPAAPRVAAERIVLHTNVGDMVLALYPEVAPRHAEQLLKLARLGVFDGVNFFRVESTFVAQLSDARYKQPAPSAEQLEAIHALPAEFSALKHRRGTLSMARYDDRPDSGETSFSILLDYAPHLDGKYTVFGQLESGLEVLDLIQRATTDERHQPLRPIVVRRAEVVDSPEALARLKLRPAGFYDERLEWMKGFMPWGGVAVVFCGLLLFVLSRRLLPAALGSAGLLLVMVAFFGLYVAYVPRAHVSQWTAVALFIGVPVFFKLMNRFESQRLGGSGAA
jgi:cyclophilin family peptidyl-prolyl cis-trans isomerase